jgi:pimeloyl-ACP methyl ester carboxylesterase
VNPITGPILSLLMSAKRLAKSLAATSYAKALSEEEIEALASIFNYQSGVRIENKIIQYLNQRKKHEMAWLDTLGHSEIPITLIWGEKDIIAPVTVADYVWGNYLKSRIATTTYWRVPCANHYLQVDQPEILAALVRAALDPEFDISQIMDADCQPFQIREAIPG